jgi:hypothetical protein
MPCVAQPVGAILLSEKESLPSRAGRMSRQQVEEGSFFGYNDQPD